MAELENEQRKRESFIGGDERKEAAMTDAGKMGGKVRTKKKKRKKKVHLLLDVVRNPSNCSESHAHLSINMFPRRSSGAHGAPVGAGGSDSGAEAKTGVPSRAGGQGRHY